MNKSRVLLNASTIVVGGGIQAAVSFIHSIVQKIDSTPFNWYFAISNTIANQLSLLGINLNDESFYIIKDSPAKNSSSRKLILDLVAKNNIDCVFTFFGPSYIKFPVPHICGVADGWVTHSDWESFEKIPSWSERIKRFLLCIYKAFWYRTADAWFVEQLAAKEGLHRRLGIAMSKIYVIGNNCAAHYIRGTSPSMANIGKARILVFASYYPNKNIESVPAIALAMKNLGCTDFEFILTINSKEPGLTRIMNIAQQLGVESFINNVGPVNILDGPSLYASCQLLLMPSVLETFSAVFPEAMAMGVPIVTINKEYARAICANAAIYYQSNKPEDAARSIYRLLNDEQLYDEMARRGFERLNAFPNTDQKYDLLINMISEHIRN